MGTVPAGIYETLLTAGMTELLAGIDAELVQLGELDPIDAHEHLARHIGRLAHRALRQAGGDSHAAVARQVELANEIIKAISALSPDSTTAEPRSAVDLGGSFRVLI